MAMMLIGIAFVSKAESYVGGTLGYGLEKVASDGYSVTANSFKIAPEGGHYLNDVWALGVSVGFKYEDIGDEGITNVTVLPYLRATFAHAGIVNFFAEIAAGYGCDIYDGYSANSFVAALRPGLVVNTSKKFALLCRTTLVGYAHYKGANDIGIAINNNVELGFMFKF